ncbi:hypothetical protein NPIL_71821, partial [Nephila pilipes]
IFETKRQIDSSRLLDSKTSNSKELEWSGHNLVCTEKEALLENTIGGNNSTIKKQE